MKQSVNREEVLKNIQKAKQKVEVYRRKSSRQNFTLLLTNICLGALTTGAAGISAVAQKSVVPGDHGWVILCGGVAALTAFTTVSATLHTAFGIATRVSSSKICNAKLDDLQDQLTILEVDAAEVLKSYHVVRDEYSDCLYY